MGAYVSFPATGKSKRLFFCKAQKLVLAINVVFLTKLYSEYPWIQSQFGMNNKYRVFAETEQANALIFFLLWLKNKAGLLSGVQSLIHYLF